MVKEFQNLKRQIIKTLVETHEVTQENRILESNLESEKQQIFIDIIGLIKEIDEMEKIKKGEPIEGSDLTNTYHYFKEQLLKLLGKHEVYPIENSNSQLPVSSTENKEAVNLEKQEGLNYLYRGKILKRGTSA